MAEESESGRVRPLRNEFRAACAALAEAFVDNPLDLAVVGGSRARRRRANLAGMRASLRAAEGRGYTRVVCAPGAEPGTERVIGALLALPPETPTLPPPPFAEQLRCLIVQRPRVIERWSQVSEVLQRVHPSVPHWYLSLLGIAPDAQRRGHGAALLRDFVARVDRDGAPAYLETDRVENTRFYASVGFFVRETVRVFDTDVFCLWRDARR